MNLSHSVRNGWAVLLSGIALLGCAVAAHAQGANWGGYPSAAYNASLPAHAVTPTSDASGGYTPAQITAQTQAGAALKTDIASKISAGQTVYTVAPGVYRFTSSGAVINVQGVHNFTLAAGGCTFVMANSGAFLLFAQHNYNTDQMKGTASDITIQGDDAAPLIVDRDLLSKTQGTITSYDPATGIMQVAIMRGYSTQVKTSDFVTAYTSAGRDIPFGYYHSIYGAYTGGMAVDASTVQVTISNASDRLDSSHRYTLGNLVTLPTTYSDTLLCSFASVDVTNLTLRNIANGAGGALFYTNGCSLKGLSQFLNVKNGPLPGTNRLGVTPFAQTSSPRGSVVMDGCEFGGTFDDSMDIQSSGFNMFMQTLTPNQILVWQIYGGTIYAVGDTVSLFADKNFANVGTAIVTDMAPYTQPSPTITDASNLWNSFKRRTKSGGSLVVLTLDQSITGATPGDYIENNSRRMTSFTMTNCYWHQTGVRVMVEGIQQGTFFHNTFDSVNGGLALVSDPYWAQGGTCQNVTVDKNVFRNCDVDKTQAYGALVLGPYWGSGPVMAGQTYGFQNVTVTNNTFIGPTLEFVHAHAVGTLNISHNVFSGGVGNAIGLYGCGGVTVSGNSIDHNNGPAVNISDSSGVDLFQNFMDNTLAPSAPIKTTSSTNVMQEYNVLSGVYYPLISVWNGKAAGIAGASASNNAKAVQWVNAGQKDHNWMLVPVGGGLYKLKNQNSGKCLVPLNQNKTTSAVMGQYSDGAGSEHFWRLTPNKDRISFRLKNVLSGLDLSVANWSTADDTPLMQSSDAATVDRYWKFITP